MSLPLVSRPHLLVAEDNPEILELVQTVLAEEGYGIATADSLATSLALLEEQLFHFVLTDLFPEGTQDPLQSIQPLLARAAPTPVGLMTGWPVTPEAAEQAGLAWLLIKPFDFDRLVKAVETTLQPPFTPGQHQTAIIERFFAAINARNWDELERLCTPGVVFVPLAAVSVPPSKSPYRLDAYLVALESRVLALPGFFVEEVAVFVRPSGLVARYTARWQNSDGILHRVAGAMRFRFEGERIVQLDW